jgi:hypothetical protein
MASLGGHPARQMAMGARVHLLDGRYLRSVGVDEQVVSLVDYYLCAQIEADVRSLGAELASSFSHRLSCWLMCCCAAT